MHSNASACNAVHALTIIFFLQKFSKRWKHTCLCFKTLQPCSLHPSRGSRDRGTKGSLHTFVVMQALMFPRFCPVIANMSSVLWQSPFASVVLVGPFFRLHSLNLLSLVAGSTCAYGMIDLCAVQKVTVMLFLPFKKKTKLCSMKMILQGLRRNHSTRRRLCEANVTFSVKS